MAQTGSGTADERIRLYDLAGSGWLNGDYVPLQDTGIKPQPADGSHSLGRVVLGNTQQYLLRVETDAPTFTLDVKERAHVDLGTMTAGTPIDRIGMDTIPKSGEVHYLVEANANDRLDVSATPDAATDIAIARLNADETSFTTVDTGLDGKAELLPAVFPGSAPRRWIAFTIRNASGSASTPELLLTTRTIPFVDICDATTTVPFAEDNEFTIVQSLPACFTFYGSRSQTSASALMAF